MDKKDVTLSGVLKRTRGVYPEHWWQWFPFIVVIGFIVFVWFAFTAKQWVLDRIK